jgi:hypothetical protein
MPTRKVKERKGPQESATTQKEGVIAWGNGDQKWVINKTSKGIKRWVPYHSTKLFGYAPLTAKILANNIGKKVKIVEREVRDFWPTSSRNFDVKYTFTPSGDGELVKKEKKKLFTGWLRKQTYKVKKNDLFFIKGEMKSKNLEAEIQVAPKPTELVSSNLMNTEAFVKI